MIHTDKLKYTLTRRYSLSNILHSQSGNQCKMIKLLKSSDDIFPWGSRSWIKPVMEHVNLPTLYSTLAVGFDFPKSSYAYAQCNTQWVPIFHFFEFFKQLLNSWRGNTCTVSSTISVRVGFLQNSPNVHFIYIYTRQKLTVGHSCGAFGEDVDRKMKTISRPNRSLPWRHARVQGKPRTPRSYARGNYAKWPASLRPALISR